MPVPTADAAHLLRRSGFGVTPAQLADLTKLKDRNAAVDRVLDLSRVPTGSLPIPAADADLYTAWTTSVHWWLDRMRTTPVPIVEKLTLFWHGHFPSSYTKAPTLRSMAVQNQLLRTNALGSFATLLKGVSVDPAMLFYLDNWLNAWWGPQENFARELLELFTMGQGNYNQTDIVTMAQAWTGHSLEEPAWAYTYRTDWHDGTKGSLFGSAAKAWTADQALTAILTGAKGVATSRFIAAKLFSYLAYPVQPADPVVTPLADAFRSSSWNVLALVRAIFKSTAFWSTTARRALVRSPIEWVVATMQATGMSAATVNPQWWLAASGQEPFNPPNVAGWGQNAYWLSSSSAWGRNAWASHMRWNAKDAGVLASVNGATPKAAVQAAFAQFGITEPSAQTRAALEAYVQRARAEGDHWAVQPNLIMLTAISPDFQVA